jgi:hypothetical protein
MAITRSQQAKQMLQDGGMLVQPSKTGNRPGYRGPGEYQGGTSSSSKSSKSSKSTSFTGGGGGGRDSGKGPIGPVQPPQQIIGGKSFDVTPFNRGDRERAELKRQIMNQTVLGGNRIDRLGNTRRQGIGSLISQFNPLSFMLGLINPALGFMGGAIPKFFSRFKQDDEENELARIANMRDAKNLQARIDAGEFDGLDTMIDEVALTRGKRLMDPTSLIPQRSTIFERSSRLNDPTLLPFQRDVIENTQDQKDDPFLKGAVAELSQKQLDYLNSPKGKLDLELLGPKDVFENRLPLYEDKPFFGSDQEPTTPEEFNEYLKSIGMTQTVKDGGRIGAQEGGIMDLESGRQMYFLGKLVKKAKRAVKKIVKSPVGKIGLGALAMKFGAPGLFKEKILPALFTKGKLTGLGQLAIAGGLTAAPLLFGQEEEEQPSGFTGSVGGNIDPRAYTDPYGVLYGAFKAEGGSMKDEPVAKRTMPLLDMGGQEMDLRAEGGFVPIGRMEKADDVPARLSKNEFVFTADAVRNAGDGDVDKGAEVMYNMMKNLEAGGEVSEESQGLKGAREMFQTSKRLEDVL